MSSQVVGKARETPRSMHSLGVVCGLVAGVWLGGAEAPAKLVTAGLSPFAVSLCMVIGVFLARWTVPTLLVGTRTVLVDLWLRRHLILWAILAGALWAVANTLTVFAIRDVGLSIAFPLWNTNSLIGIFWGWLLFNEMRGASANCRMRVIGGALAIFCGALGLALETITQHAAFTGHPLRGICSALVAGLLWGTMYVPYRKAYLSGMNPLSFITVFTVGELCTMGLLALHFSGGMAALSAEWTSRRAILFWLFLGGFCWVIGDMFQQYATKYVGIGRGIPLSNTNQLWGLAWGALVFHEFARVGPGGRALALASSLVMIGGAALISSSSASAQEHESRDQAIERECDRYGLSLQECMEAQQGVAAGGETRSRSWWDWLIVACAVAVLAFLARGSERPGIRLSLGALSALGAIMLVAAGGGAVLLWKRTRFH